MKKTAFFPKKYFQDEKIIKNLYKLISKYIIKNPNPFLISDDLVLEILLDNNLNIDEFVFGGFKGEVTEEEIERQTSLAKSSNANCIVGAGGGKAIDMTRAVANNLKIPVITVPTIAATDSATSSLAVVYNEDHKRIYTIRTNNNPDLILVDSKIIIEAPIRYLVAGMGDAIATKFEAEAVNKSDSLNFHEGRPTSAVLAICDETYNIIINNGVKAKEDALKGYISPEFNKIIEANILLSGIGFESGGLSIAHGLHTGFSALSETKNMLHGEIIAFCTLIQLKLEINEKLRNKNYLNKLLAFYQDVGLPTSLNNLNITKEVEKMVKVVVNESFYEGNYIFNTPCSLTKEGLEKTILSFLK